MVAAAAFEQAEEGGAGAIDRGWGAGVEVEPMPARVGSWGKINGRLPQGA